MEKKIERLLKNNKIAFRVRKHTVVETCKEQAEKARIPQQAIAKSLIFKTDKGKYILAVGPGNKSLNRKKLQEILKAERLTLATPQEVKKLAGCDPGAVHAFGQLLNLDTYLDKDLLKNKTIFISPGSHTETLEITLKEYLKLVKPKQVGFEERPAKEGETKGLTVKKSDFSEWYGQVLQLANIMDKRYEVKGCNVWLNYGYEIMLRIKAYWDMMFRESGIKEMYFPLLVPEKYCEKNPSWWEGFKNQAYWVNIPGEEEKYILRPTGEPAMYPMFSLWIRSHNDLPFRIYETVSSFRYETKHTRPMIRDREITVWHEIHTAHATKKEADREMKEHIRLYDFIWKKCALAPLRVNKPEWEIFPGAVGAVEYYNLMPGGRTMENGSVNNLGQAYAKKFNIKFRDKDEKEKYAWMLCTGNGARLLAAIIAVHGDDRGFIMPPEVAPIEVVIIPIYKNETKKAVVKKCSDLLKKLRAEGFRTELDLRGGITPGEKFYDWEMKGVPIRLELGPRDMKSKSVVLVRRDTGRKQPVRESALPKTIKNTLSQMQAGMLKKSQRELDEAIQPAKTVQDMKNRFVEGKIARVHWCGSGKCWDLLKEIREGVELFGTDLKPAPKGKCVMCGKPTATTGYVANTY